MHPEDVIEDKADLDGDEVDMSVSISHVCHGVEEAHDG